ncbi:MAG: hypothetical protein J0L92_20775 [Deltaproteobacteria bacterium]|nr:hypothetical protein [Deltaproteobacteria bacterium]
MAEEALEIGLGRSFYVVLAVAGIGSFGILAVVLLLLALPWPRRLDADGIVTRGGTRHAWSDFERVAPLRGKSFRLHFRSGRVNVVPTLLDDPSVLLSRLGHRGIRVP